MSNSIRNRAEPERPRRAYDPPSLTKREKLAGITAIPVTSGIATDTASR